MRVKTKWRRGRDTNGRIAVIALCIILAVLVAAVFGGR